MPFMGRCSKRSTWVHESWVERASFREMRPVSVTSIPLRQARTAKTQRTVVATSTKGLNPSKTATRPASPMAK